MFSTPPSVFATNLKSIQSVKNYDISNKESFNQIKYWLDQIKTTSEESTKYILVGTKCDLDEREVPEEKGINLAQKLGIKFLETSAKLNININETFETLIDEILLNFKVEKRKSLMISSKKMNKKNKAFTIVV